MKVGNLKTSTILIVDDNPSNLDVLSEALTGSGWEILVATDGETAIELRQLAQGYQVKKIKEFIKSHRIYK